MKSKKFVTLKKWKANALDLRAAGVTMTMMNSTTKKTMLSER
jgi:hypothetical protein